MNPNDYQPRDFLWSQRDIRWSWKKLGKSSLTVGGYGCAALCCTYVIDRRMKDLNRGGILPGDFVNRATFTPGGSIYWNSVDAISGGAVRHTSNPAESRYRLMEVVWGTYHHWIVLLDGDLAYDPWDGKIKNRVQSQWYPSGRYIYFKVV